MEMYPRGEWNTFFPIVTEKQRGVITYILDAPDLSSFRRSNKRSVVGQEAGN
jgi:hypothetical protein